ncbi:hypothetical protein BDZ90DRAFT_232084 [Jaminaea rosea]|uniref:Peptidase S49 domain-containing protein n=1 Tax=Jaminaea rosea TaxID=1569628 RepID=A0A316UUT5_9BASI|nr:hypothetical protein BDZ90DRAFT_232084 [Jaminaea rosea]PWN27673.1 hypothetical protein BDZ90DRAFT_232084 [Jaminaea rosea]
MASSQASWFARRLPNAHARYQSIASSRVGRTANFTWKYRRYVFFTLGATYIGGIYALAKLEAAQRDEVKPNTYLYMKVYPGSIVEVKGPPSLSHLAVSPSAGEDPPRTMELVEIIKAIKWAEVDPRIRGLFADFSTLNWPSNRASEGLGLAQIEELMQAIHDFKVAKDAQFPPPEAQSALTDGKEQDDNVTSDLSAQPSGQVPVHLPSTVAFADTFLSQSSYLLASAFEKVYLQPSGSLPLVGVSAQVPFFSRLLGKLGVKMHSEARREYKSMISQFVEEDGLTKPQAENEAQLLGELNRSVAYGIGVNRFREIEDADEAADKVADLMQRGPFSAKEAEEVGLIDGRMYKGDVVNMFFPHREGTPDLKGVFDPATGELTPAAAAQARKQADNDDQDESETLHFKTLPHYSRVQAYATDKLLNEDSKINVAVCYLRGSISSASGDYSASAVVKGLREAADDDDITGIVLRIDSGGGDVVASDSIWHAIRRVKETTGKPVVVSFGNVAASGSYYAATAADAIFASESTVTGSIGVASLRPTLKQAPLFDWAGVRVQSFFTGSKAESLLHEMDEGQLARQKVHIDETYEDFLEKVCKGRGITSGDVVEGIAGGRVFTGLAAWSLTSPESLRPRVASRRGGSGAVNISTAADEIVRRAEEALGLSASSSRFEDVTFEPERPLSEWDLEDATREGELRTTLVKLRKRGSRTSSSNEEASEDEATSSFSAAVGDAASSLASSLSSTSSPQDGQEAHLAATRDAATSSSSSAERHVEESLRTTPPYGRGLVDAIGGVWEAAAHAVQLGLIRETMILMQEKGLTSTEEAFAALRPGCVRERPIEPATLEQIKEQVQSLEERAAQQKAEAQKLEEKAGNEKGKQQASKKMKEAEELTQGVAMMRKNVERLEANKPASGDSEAAPQEEGESSAEGASGVAAQQPQPQMSLTADVRLIKYPKDRTVLERVRELNKRGDAPSLSLGQWAGVYAAEAARTVLGDAAAGWFGGREPAALLRAWVGRTVQEEAEARGLRGGVRMEYGGLGGEAR